MDDSRYFTMNQLWQSIVITVAIGGILAAGIAYGITDFSQTSSDEVSVATTTQELSALPAAVSAARTDPFANIQISGKAAIVVDLATGKTLYSQAADMELPLASLTKLITVYGAQQALQAGSPVTISSSSLSQEGEYGLLQGETFTYENLARFALVSSSNDAAEAIAEAAAGARGVSSEGFMQGAISSAGLERTRAQNSTGLDIDLTEASAYGTARDMAKLASKFLAASPELSKWTTRPSVSVYSREGTLHSLPNTNPRVGAVPGLLLSKTGYTDLAGGNLVIVFDAAIGHPVAVVVLGSTRDARFTDVQTLVRATLASFTSQ
jgi:D-alanyl-D-alanine carboxypeptidase